MAMYFMTGKTFLNKYIKEDPSKVMRTQFVVVSSTIRKTGKYKKQVINANNILFPTQSMIIDYDDYKHNKNYQDEYFEMLHENKAFLATLIKYVIEENYTVVFLCGKRESKYYYLQLIKKFMQDEFDFYMYDYKKFKEGKEKIHTNSSYTLSMCNKILKKAAKEKKERALSTEKGRKELFHQMSKKEMKKELKERLLYYEGMSRAEMEDTLDAFM
jgi:hypothetical protein